MKNGGLDEISRQLMDVNGGDCARNSYITWFFYVNGIKYLI